MGAAGVLPGDIEAGQVRPRIGVADQAAHEIMRRRHDLDPAAGEVEAAVGAAPDHAAELRAHRLRPQMAHRDIDAAVGRGPALAHLREDRPADDIAGCALARVVVIEHEAAPVAVEQVAAGAAQPFLQHRAGHARVRAGEQAGRVELHHLHVAQGQAAAQGHGQPVHALVARRRVVAVHGRPAAGRQQHRLGPDEAEGAAAHIGEQHAGERAAGAVRHQGERPVLLQPVDRPGEHLLHQPVDDLDPGQVALVNRAVEGLAGEGLLVQRAVGVAVEEAADLVLEFADAHRRGLAQPPGDLLMGQPLAAGDGVHEMALDRIAGAERHIVAALHHAGAAGLAEQALDGDRHRQFRRRPAGVQGREQAGPARADDQDVGIVPVEG